MEKERNSVDCTDGFEEVEDPQTEDETLPGPPGTSDERSEEVGQKPTDEERKPGKQPGAEGFGRQQTLAVTGQDDDVPEFCACCRQALNANAKKAWTAFETVDLEWADESHPGLRLTNIRHTYYEIPCACGHVTRKEPRCRKFIERTFRPIGGCVNK